jgi:CBS domain-containing protein
MKRWVYAHSIVDGDPGQLDRLLRERIRALLWQATGTMPSPPAVDGTFRLRLEADVAGRNPGKDVRVCAGVAEDLDDRTRISLAWHAEPARHAFPAFEGALELEPLSARHAQLMLAGAYRVPLGPLGAAADSIGLNAVAQHTVEALVGRLGTVLSSAVATAEPAPTAAVSPSTAMHVADVMTTDPMVFDEALSLRTAALLLVHRGVQGAPVVSDTGALVGVLSEHDLLEKEAAFRPALGRDGRERERRRSALTVGEACSRPARVTVPDATLREAARAMLDHRVARLVVVDGSALVGIITRHDVLKALLRSDAELQAAVEALLADLAEPDVRAQVIWGEVTLSGVVTLRSRVAHVVQSIADIDGVVAVHGEPAWQEDDVLASAYGLRVP